MSLGSELWTIDVMNSSGLLMTRKTPNHEVKAMDDMNDLGF